MQKTTNSQRAKSAHRKVQVSASKNRKSLKSPATKLSIQETKASPKTPTVKQSSRISHMPKMDVEMPKAIKTKTEMPKAEMPKVEMPKADISAVNARMRMRMAPKRTGGMVSKMSAQEIKETAIKKAISNASSMPERRERTHVRFGWKRILLAASCSAAVVLAIMFFANLASPDVSLKVAAMQTGIEATYPSYIPRDFNISDISSESGRITLNFTNSSNGETFSITEEKSTWDSAALLTNYVKDFYGEDYTAVKEQGLTIYISGSDAAWVNGGIIYKLKTIRGSLTKKQIRAIAVSL